MHGGLGRRRRQRSLAAVLRQLLRATRLRVRAGPDARHRLHDGGLPESRRPGGHRRREVDRRLAQRPRPRLQGCGCDVAAGGRRLAQRQLGDDRQVLRRHAGQRRCGDRRRRPEDDRPGLGDLRLVPLLAHGGRAAQQQLPGRQPQRDGHDRRPEDRPRASTSRTAGRCAPRSTRSSTRSTATRTATSTSSGATATTSRTRATSRPRCSPSTASRTTTSAWTTSGCGGTR